jgi:hypothetical protein
VVLAGLAARNADVKSQLTAKPDGDDELLADVQMNDVIILGSDDKLLPQVAREDMQSENSCPA